MPDCVGRNVVAGDDGRNKAGVREINKMMEEKYTPKEKKVQLQEGG